MRKTSIEKLYLNHIKDIIEDCPGYNPTVHPYLVYRDGSVNLRLVSFVPYQENAVTDYSKEGKDFTIADLKKVTKFMEDITNAV